MGNNFDICFLTACVQFLLYLIIFLGLLLTLPKDSGGVGDVKENSQKGAKLDGKK